MAITDFKDCAELLATAISGATGKATTTALNTADFVKQATTALEIGVDPIMKAISNMVTKTIFSARPYNQKFKGILRDNEEWGNHVRKINYIDDEPVKDERGMDVANQPAAGATLTPWEWKPNKVVQTNFYGGNVYQRSKMLTRDQIYNAFGSPEQFGSFVSGLMVNLNNMIEQDKDTMARMAISNYIGGKIAIDSTNVINVLERYNTETGLNLTTTTVFAPENFTPFVRWLYAFVENLSNFMTERSYNYHVNLEDKELARHTPKSEQRLFMYSPALTKINSIAKAETYHENLLNMDVTEAVNFWQNINNPESISVNPSYIDKRGATINSTTTINSPYILGVLVDRETIGETVISEWSGTTPLDPKHGITNLYMHYTIRFWNDFTENGVILTMADSK